MHSPVQKRLRRRGERARHLLGAGNGEDDVEPRDPLRNEAIPERRAVDTPQPRDQAELPTQGRGDRLLRCCVAQSKSQVISVSPKRTRSPFRTPARRSAAVTPKRVIRRKNSARASSSERFSISAIAASRRPSTM